MLKNSNISISLAVLTVFADIADFNHGFMRLLLQTVVSGDIT
jgi:hypothetical protein